MFGKKLQIVILIASLFFFIVSSILFILNKPFQPAQLHLGMKEQKDSGLEMSEDAKLTNTPTKTYQVDNIGVKLARDLRSYTGIQMGIIYGDQLDELGQKTPYPESPKYTNITKSEADSLGLDVEGKGRIDYIYSGPLYETKNRLIFAKYQIDTPIIHSQLSDLFALKDNNEIDFQSQLEEDQREILKGDYTSVPIQKLLTKGVVRLPYSVLPGNKGNSYIVGHSSNYSTVKSDYNFVFAPFINQKPIGEIFTIYDHMGRKLNFEVFEAIEVVSEDTKTAFKNYPDQRVVSLQGSILEDVDGRLQPTKRWIIRAKLII